MQIRERFISTHAPNGRSNRFWIGVIGELNQNKGQEVIIDQFTRYAPSHTELFCSVMALIMRNWLVRLLGRLENTTSIL